MKCKYETKNGRCGLKGSYAYRRSCYGEDFCKCIEPQTNGDWLRSLDDEALAEVLWKSARNYRVLSADHIRDWEEHRADLLDWLKQPHESEG